MPAWSLWSFGKAAAVRIKRTTCDALFSNYVRARDKWTCQMCDRRFPKGAQNLHCAHIYSRRHWAGRHWTGSKEIPSNAIALCFFCHQSSGENPISFARWCDERFGAEAMDRLYAFVHQTSKKTKYEEDLRIMGLKEMLARLEAVNG